MDRVSSTGYQTIDGRRTWQNKNLGAGIQGTTEDQIWFAGVQESIIAVYEQLGITPADVALGSVDLQLLQAIRRIAGGTVTSISAPTATLTADNAGLVLITASSNNVALTLPASASSNGQSLPFLFLRWDSSGNSVTLTLAGSDLFFPGGATPISITSAALVTMVGDGLGQWIITSAQVAPSHGEAEFITSGSWTAPPGVTTVYPDGCAGGGGGEYGGSGVAGGTGGGGGDWLKGTNATALTVVPGTTYPITIGAGGTGGTSGSPNGTNGGTTSIGALLSLNGGVSGGGGGAGGSGTGIGGSAGQTGNYTSSGGSGSFSEAGGGGSGGFGAGGGAGWGAQAGQAAAGFGAGGGGGAGGANGAAGTGGFVRLRW